MEADEEYDENKGCIHAFNSSFHLLLLNIFSLVTPICRFIRHFAEFPSKLKQQDIAVIFSVNFLLVPYVDDEIPLPFFFMLSSAIFFCMIYEIFESGNCNKNVFDCLKIVFVSSLCFFIPKEKE